MKKSFLILSMAIISFILFCGFVSASDVAYVLKSPLRVDTGFLEAFEEMDLEVELIDDSDIGETDFSEYQFIFIEDGRLKNVEDIPLDEVPLVIANGRYGKEFGLLDKGRIRKLVSSSPLKIKKDGEKIQVYEKSRFKTGGIGVPYYYLPFNYKNEDMETIATTMKKRRAGDVIAYSSEDVGKCFFGITETKYWTEETKELFVDCVDYVLGMEKNHDVLLNEEFDDSIDGIRIEDMITEEFLTTPISKMCNDYEFKVKLENVGEYVEDVSIVGTISGPEDFEDTWTGSKNNFNPGSSTTVSGKHSEDFCEGFVEGIYTLSYEAQIDNDENPKDNILEIDFQLVSDDWEPFHDVNIVEDYVNSVNGIRIKDVDAGEYLLDSIAVLDCTKEYKIDYKTINDGSYIEDITLEGVLGGFSWDAQKTGLVPGKSTTSGSKTINENEFLEIGTGLFDLEISAILDLDEDDYPENNIRNRAVEVVC